jgi:VIT1/CCC1 family predicted Fe2+/Mn2+ transporter
MRAQTELFEKEIALEAREHQRNPNVELVELTQIYQSRGIDPDRARDLAADIMSNPALALETHAREELGVSPDQLGNPLGAGLWSFGAFSIGAVVPLAPWLFAAGAAAVIASIVLSALAALVVGATLAWLTEKSPVRLALRQLLFAAIPAAVTFSIGSAIGISAA